MYEAVIDAISKRANRQGVAYVEDYGASIHKTARLSFDDTLEVIETLERLGWATVTRTTMGFPIAVKLLKNPRECKETVATMRQELVNVLNQATSLNMAVEVSTESAYN